MLTNYGYEDASGNYFITIDTDKCDGCGDCIPVCPADVFYVLEEDPNDPMRDGPVVVVDNAKKNKLKYECAPCKPTENRPDLPCVAACPSNVISHFWSVTSG